MSDGFLDFVEEHRTLIKIGAIVLIVLLVVLIVVSSSNRRKAEEAAKEEARLAAMQALESQPVEVEPESTEEAPEIPTYDANLGLGQKTDGRVEYVEPSVPGSTEPEPIKRQTYKTDVKVWGWTSVPDKAVNGDNWKGYLSEVSLSLFGVKWGTPLTEDDFSSTTKYFIGVEQNPDDTEYGNLQSVGWLHENLATMSDSTAIKFTNLHVIGSLSEDHVAVLCSYDWYSAFGLENTLVVFEDMSGTLNVDDFKDGAIFSATVFKHNVKSVELNGENVICAEYNVFQ